MVGGDGSVDRSSLLIPWVLLWPCLSPPAACSMSCETPRLMSPDIGLEC